MYRVMLECVATYQESLTTDHDATAISNDYKDGDDVHYRFGGAVICEMLKLHYQKIRSYSDEQRDQLSQEICILRTSHEHKG